MRYQPIKRLIDLTVSLALLIMLVPLFVVVSALIMLTSPGPVFFRHARVGRNGRTFQMLKFRTMVPNAQRFGPAVTQERDPRITRIGRILRKTKVDELPQLYNVLMGDMSLVGPRPEVREYVNLYPELARKEILSVRPGITGRTQVWLRHEESLLAEQKDPVEFYKYTLLPRKVESDLQGVRQMSASGDMKLLFLTALCCLSLEPKVTETPSDETHPTAKTDAVEAV